MRHGHGSKSDVIDQQTERFFRAVDRAVDEHHSKPSGLPLILAALSQHHAPFRSVSHNAHLVASGIDIDPEALSIDALRERAWQVMEPVYRERLAALADRFAAACASQLGDDRLHEVAEAAAGGRVATLLLEADRHVPGRLEAASGRVHRADLEHPEVDDVLDDLAEHVMRTGGEVAIVPASNMPSTTGLAAIYRY